MKLFRKGNGKMKAKKILKQEKAKSLDDFFRQSVRFLRFFFFSMTW